jgi:hypothetical protein
MLQCAPLAAKGCSNTMTGFIAGGLPLYRPGEIGAGAFGFTLGSPAIPRRANAGETYDGKYGGRERHSQMQAIATQLGEDYAQLWGQEAKGAALAAPV